MTVGKTYTESVGKSPLCLVRSLNPLAHPEFITCSPVSWSRTMRSPLRKLRNPDSSPTARKTTVSSGFFFPNPLEVINLSICLLLGWVIYLPGFGLSWRVTTYLDLFLSPSRKVTTRSRISSALLEVKVYSSPLMVAKVKLCPCNFPPLGYVFIGDINKKRNGIKRQSLEKGWFMVRLPAKSVPPYLLLDTAVISGKESSKRTCSCSSTKYTPVQLTATITSFLGRLGPEL